MKGPSRDGPQKNKALFPSLLRAAGASGRLPTFAARFRCQLAVLRERSLLGRHAAATLARDLPLPLLVHRSKASIRGGIAFRHELPPSQVVRLGQPFPDSMVPATVNVFCG